jgi:hypothetical protein
VAEYEIIEAISDFDRALVQGIDDHIAFLNGIILIQKLEERTGKGLEIGMTTAVVAGLDELPDNPRKLLALLTKLPDQTSENGIELLEFGVVEVEVVVGKTGVGLRLAELLEVIDDGRAYDYSRTESGRGTRYKRGLMELARCHVLDGRIRTAQPVERLVSLLAPLRILQTLPDRVGHSQRIPNQR